MLLKARLSQRQNINTIQSSKILPQTQTTKLSLYIQTTMCHYKTPKIHKEHPCYLLAPTPATRTHTAESSVFANHGSLPGRQQKGSRRSPHRQPHSPRSNPCSSRTAHCHRVPTISSGEERSRKPELSLPKGAEEPPCAPARPLPELLGHRTSGR